MTQLIWQGNVFEQREADNYVCLTQMAKIFSKKVNHWLDSSNSKAYIEAVSSETGIPASQLLVSLKGNSGNFEQGTWAHPLIAIAFAQWLSPEFHVWCNLHIKILIESSSNKQQEIPRTTPSLLTNETIKTHIDAIKYLTESGNKELAELMQIRLSNLMMVEQEQVFDTMIDATVPVFDDNLETVLDVARRLGFQVPKNYYCTLGKYVKRRCPHLVNDSYARHKLQSPAKQIIAARYPVKDREVEDAVIDYCLKKQFHNTLTDLKYIKYI